MSNDPNQVTEPENSRVYDNLAPSIAKLDISLWTRQQILDMAVGQVTQPIISSSVKDPAELDNKIGSIYDKTLFGCSKDSIPKSTSNDHVVREEETKRKSNWGYIKLPIPFVIPGYADKRFIQKILSTRKGDAIKEAVNWSAFIARPIGITNKNNTPADYRKMFEFTKKFITAHEKEIKSANAGPKKLIHIVAMVNSHTTATETGTSLFETFFVIDSKLFSNSNKASSYGELGKIETWKQYFKLLPGSYGIYDLLNSINVDDEIAFAIYAAAHYSESKVKYLKSCGIADVDNTRLTVKQLRKIKAYDKDIDTQRMKYKLLMGLKQQGAKPSDLVTDVIPVMPPYWRDSRKINNGGKTKYTQDGINTFYNGILAKLNAIRQFNTNIDFDKLLDYDNLSVNDRSTVDMSIEALNDNQNIWNAMSVIQSDIEKYLTSNTEDKTGGNNKTVSLLKRTSGKTANNRGFVLGKRIDETARSVITVDQTLRIDEIGVPYDILKVHFKYELEKMLEDELSSGEDYRKTIEYLGDRYDNPIQDNDFSSGFNVSYQSVNTSVKERKVYNALVQCLKSKRYLAIRYPSLHKWNELGYKIKIVYDQTIHLNPLVCSGYNADFDGDQMSLFLATFKESVKEIDEILSPAKNDMNANGEPMLTPGQDMIMGLYILTLKPDKKTFDKMPIKGRFANVKELRTAIELGIVDLHDKVSVMMPHYENSNFKHNYYYDNVETASYQNDTNMLKYNSDEERVEAENTLLSSNEEMVFAKYHCDISKLKEDAMRGVVSTAGRFIFNEIIPQDLKFRKRVKGDDVKSVYDPANFLLEWDPDNEVALSNGLIKGILKDITNKYNQTVSFYVKDNFKSYGYRYVSESGISISINDLKTMTGRDEEIEEGYRRIEDNKKRYTGKELTEKNIEVWKDVDKTSTEKGFAVMDPENPIKVMAVSGARGSLAQIKQLVNMRGIMMDASGRQMETPILRNFYEGLDSVAYITSSYGSIKGMIDRSRNTAQTGDLARHCNYGTYNVVITDGDCGDTEGFLMKDFTFKKTNAVMSQEELDEKIEFISLKMIDGREKAIQIRQLENHISKGFAVIDLRKDIIGRTLVEDIVNPETNEVIFEKGLPVYPTYYSDDFEDRLLDLEYYYGDTGVRVRTLLTCKSPTGKCARCSGYFFAKHSFAKVGDAVGFTTAQAISEPATQLTMRTFHTGGIADGDITGSFDAIKNVIVHGHVSNQDIINRIVPLLSVATKEVIREGCAAFDKLREKLNDPSVRKATLSETIHGITYDGLTLENFGYLHYNLCTELSNAMIREVRAPYALNDLNLVNYHFELIAMQTMSNMKILYSPDSKYQPGDVIKATALLSENLKLAYNSKRPILAVPMLTGYKQLVVDVDNPISSLFFQRPGEVLSFMSLVNASDNMTSPMTAIGVGNTLPLGGGYAHYQELIKERLDAPPKLLSDYLPDTSGLEAFNDVENFASLTEEDKPPVMPLQPQQPVQSFNTAQPSQPTTQPSQPATMPHVSVVTDEEDDPTVGDILADEDIKVGDVIGWDDELVVEEEDNQTDTVKTDSHTDEEEKVEPKPFETDGVQGF